MRALFGLVLIVGMALAGSAVYMVRGYMADQQAALDAERARAQQIVETTEVYAVNRAIGYGERLTPEDVTLIKYATEFLPEGTFATEEELFPEGTEVLRSVTLPMEPNEVLMAAKMTDPGVVPGITQQLRDGMSAFTIQVDVSSAVSGFVRPGSFVDIYWSNDGGQDDGTGGTHLIGQSIELIAVNQSTDPNRSEAEVPRTVTVQVSKADVASLAEAQDNGHLRLALVGAEQAANARVADGEPAISLPEPEEVEVVVADAPPPVVQEQVCVTTVNRGTERVELPIPCSN